MTDHDAILALAKKQLRFPLPPVNDSLRETGVTYARTGGRDLLLDLYLPAGGGKPFPAVVHVNGYPFPAEFMSAWQPTISWARLLQSRGIASVIYETAEPVTDSLRLLDFLGQYGGELGVDTARIGLMASSGHGPNALGLLLARPGQLRCAVLQYSFLLDLDDDTAVADASEAYGFVNPVAGMLMRDVPAGIPLLLTRAGREHFAGLTANIERFAARALALNLPLTVINHPPGVHGFDLEEQSPACRAVIGQELAFLEGQLTGAL